MDMTPKLLAQMLAQQAETVAKHLLPQGKRDGAEWRAGSTNGEPGESLGVHLKGDKAGVWRDFATDDGGDLLDLWRETKGLSMAETITQAKAWLGVKEMRPTETTKSYRKPVKPNCSKPKGEELRWLTEDRALPQEAVEAYQIATAPGKVVFPFKDARGDVRMVKTRSLSDGKCKPTSKEQRPTLFGWQAIPEDARRVAIVEGELDAPSLWAYGLPALSVPFGGGSGDKQAWIENEYDDLLRFDEILLCMDDDGTGQKGTEAIIQRLGRERCRVMRLPRKDGNDCLKDGVTIGEFVRAVDSAVYLEPDELQRASAFEEQVLWALHPERAPVDHTAIRVPWGKAESELEFRMSEVALLAGVNGHGKTQMAGYLTLHAMLQGARACIASMEMPTPKILANMARQAAGSNDPADGYVRHILRWMDERQVNYTKKGRVTPENLLDMFRYARKRHACNWFLLDSLSMCGIGEDDYNRQKAFVQDLENFANDENVFVLLLAHGRKGDDEDRPMGKMDVKGTGAITDMVDTVMTLWRNKPKEKRLSQHNLGSKALDDEQLDELLGKPDALLLCSKQRHQPEGKEPTISLWFDPVSLQYLGGPKHDVTHLIEFSGTPEEAPHAQA